MRNWQRVRCTSEIRPGVKCNQPVDYLMDGVPICYRCAEPLMRHDHHVEVKTRNAAAPAA